MSARSAIQNPVCGQITLAGEQLQLMQKLDALFLQWAGESGATERLYPSMIEARELDKIGYLQSFPNLATFPIALSPEQGAHAACTHGYGGIRLNGPVTPGQVLTPAACYHCYIEHQGQNLEQALYLTTRATCFRQEEEYLPLQRQWAFNMREIVCVGPASTVQKFLRRLGDRALAFLDDIGVAISVEQATDPFFDPRHSPGYLAQIAQPLKHELQYRGSLAVCSTNYHRDFFGRSFAIEFAGTASHSGCIAFGLERWLYLVLEEFGSKPSGWPAILRKAP